MVTLSASNMSNLKTAVPDRAGLTERAKSALKSALKSAEISTGMMTKEDEPSLSLMSALMDEALNAE